MLSFALVDQLRSVDKARVRKVFGSVGPQEMQAIDIGLCLYLGLDEKPLFTPA